MRSRRVALVAAVILGLGACGSDSDESADSTSTTPAATDASTTTVPGDTVPGDGPPVIHVGEVGTDGVGAVPAAGDSIAEGEMDSSKMFAANIEYVFDGAVADEMTSPATAWYFPQTGAVVTDEVVAELATVFGIEGPVEVLDEGLGGGKIVGPSDYTGPSVTVGVDSMQSWWFSMGNDLQVTNPMCAAPEVEPSSSEQTSPETPLPDECVPEPPEGVPTAAEAEALTTDLMGRLGLDPSSFEYETYADEWSASVNAYLVLEGVRANVSMYFSYGGDAALTWAGGFLATPQRGEDYPRIGVTAGVDRLNEPFWLSGDELASDAVVEDTKSADPVDEQSAPAEIPDTVTPDGDVPVETLVADDPVLVDPMPCDPAADCMPVDAAPIVVHLTNPQPSLEQLWGDDDTIWLLPGYSFDSTDEGVYSVIAVDDAYLEASEPEPATDPGLDSVPPATVVTDTVAPDGTTTDTAAPSPEMILVGETVEEAAKLAEQYGWELRVVREDGEDLAVTDDLRDYRVNVAVVDGMVMEVVSMG